MCLTLMKIIPDFPPYGPTFGGSISFLTKLSGSIAVQIGCPADLSRHVLLCPMGANSARWMSVFFSGTRRVLREGIATLRSRVGAI